MPVRILVLYTAEEATPFQEHVSLHQLLEIETALRSIGIKCCTRRYTRRTLGSVLSEEHPDLVFNLAYGYASQSEGVAETQSAITARLEQAGMTIVGSSSKAQALAQDKLACGIKLAPHGIASPRNIKPDNYQGRFPRVLVRKPRFGACHRHIELVNSNSHCLSNLTEDFLLQEYIHGPEFTVAVLEVRGTPQALPVLRIRFKNPRERHVMVPGAFEWDIECDRTDAHNVSEVAVRAFRALRLRDYARFDFRIRRRIPVLLDANSLPHLDPERSYFPLAAKIAGMSYPELILAIVDSAMRRSARKHANINAFLFR